VDGVLEPLGMDSTSAAFVLAGVLVLVLALRAARNAAIAVRARIFAIGTGLGLATWGLKGPLQLEAVAEEALGPWIDEPHEQVVIAIVVLAVLSAVLTLFSLYMWIRALIRVASFALVGLALLAVAGIAWIASEGGLGFTIPPLLGIDGLVLCEIAGIALLVIGAVRALRPKPGAAPKRA
jgi:hypothetical protein